VRRTFLSAGAAHRAQMEEQEFIRKNVLPLANYESAFRTMRKVAKSGPVDTGHYRHGWEVRRRATSKWMKGTRLGLAARRLTNVPDVSLVNTTPYSGVLEQGARPFWPPIAPLIAWAERKAGALALAGILDISPKSFATRPDGSLRYRGRASLNAPEKRAVRSFAYAVQRKISKDGLPALWIMRNHLPYAREMIRRSVQRQLRALSAKGSG